MKNESRLSYMRIGLGNEKKKKKPLGENKADGNSIVFPAPSVLHSEPGFMRHGCHDNKHLRRVLEKLMNLRVSPSFPIFQRHTKTNTPAHQISNSITSPIGYNYSILIL